MKQDWNAELNRFIEAEPVTPPTGATFKILSKVAADLNPTATQVHGKALLIYALTGLFTLLICPQFDIQLFNGMGLMHIYMQFGEAACNLACGATFMGISMFMVSIFMNREESRVLRRLMPLKFITFSVLGVAAFATAGAQIFVGLTLYWVLGSTLAGLGTYTLGQKLKAKLT